MRRARPLLPLLPTTALFLGMLLPAASPAAATAAAERPRLDALRIPFVAAPDEAGVRFSARTPRGVVSVTPAGKIHYLLPRRGKGRPAPKADEHAPETPAAVKLHETLVGADVREVAGRGRAPTRVNVFHGSDPRRWRRNLPAFEGLSLGEVYPGIEMTLHVRGYSVEKIFTIAPGGDPDAIRLRLAGGRGLAVTPEGELAVATHLGEVRFSAPVAYQEDREGSSAREPVAVAYRVEGDEYAFALGTYDRSRPLVVDPILAATFYGGLDADEAFAIDRNAAGVYAAGETYFDLPGIVGGAADSNGSFGLPRFSEGWVVKLDPGLTTILDATYLGGSGDDTVYGLVLDPTGGVYVTGTTGSSNFPGIGGGAADDTFSGDSEGFVARLDADLSNIEEATFLGGLVADGANALFRDVAGKIYVAGYTRSPDFPGVDGSSADSLFQGYGEAFVARLDADLENVEAATYLGGVSCEGAQDVIRSGLGPVFAVGFTRSPDFPGVGSSAFDPNFDGDSEAFVARLDPDLTSLSASFIGGSHPNNTSFLDLASAVDEDSAGNLFVGGSAYSPNSFPGIGPASADDVFHDGEGFVVKLNQNLTAVLGATWLGGNTWDGIRDLRVDAAQRVWVTGYSAGSFPEPGGNFIGCGSGPPDYGAFAAALDAGLSAILASECTRWGSANALVLAPTGLYTAGVTDDGFFGGPPAITPASADDVQSGDEGFVLHLDLGLPAPLFLKFGVLRQLLKQFFLSGNLPRSLLAAVERAEALGAGDRDTQAIKAMERFVHRVKRTVRRGELTPDQGAELMRQAEGIIEGLTDQAALDPVAPDRRRPRERPPLPTQWSAMQPPYRWQPPMVNIPGDFPPTPTPGNRIVGGAAP
jgi:hypothetical protein